MTLGKTQILKNLQRIPGVGTKIAQDLWEMDIRSVSDLKNRDPEQLYSQICIMQGRQVDRCMLYVFRCAVYYASERNHDPVLLHWWNWSDSKMGTMQEKAKRI
ncbi:MAG: pathogenicity locus [Calditrichaeota bacterium]|nr:helix-hairpin-helix domain-containing protein [Calditrichota bacterium]RQW06947.1 MAG: pathogenicity locus [Calditrichota bacterium]